MIPQALFPLNARLSHGCGGFEHVAGFLGLFIGALGCFREGFLEGLKLAQRELHARRMANNAYVFS
jgi:hypothetical protein